MVQKFASAYCLASLLLTFVFLPFIALCADLPFPVALYPLNELYNAGDASCYGNLAGRVQGASLVPGPFGNTKTAYEFTGFEESYINIPQSEHLDVKNSITILAWIFQTGRAGSVILYWNEGRGVELRTSNASTVSVQFTKRNGETVPSLINSTLNLQNTWHYIGASYNHNTGIATLWLGGKKVQQLNLGRLELRTNGDVLIGGGQGNGDSFEGKVSCVQIYNKVLSQDEILAVKDRCFTENLVAVDCAKTSAPSGCGVQMSSLSGTFYSPGYPAGYPNSAKCVWEIKAPEEYTITLKFSRFQLEASRDCPDYVIIRDGTTSWSEELYSICGANPDQDWEKITSTGNGMRVEFISDKSGSDVGFVATYTTSPVREVSQEEIPEDISRHFTGIVIGVACAAIFTILSIITFNHTRRRIMGRNSDGSRRRTVTFDGDDVFQQNAPPTYDDVMRCPELYPPTPCPGSMVNTPAATPRWGSPTGSPSLSRHSIIPPRPTIIVPKTGTPIGMPIFTPRRVSSNHSTPLSTPRMSLQRGISPLVRAELTPQHSRHAGQLSSDEDDDELPPYPGIVEDVPRQGSMRENVDSVLDQVREALELNECQCPHAAARPSNSAVNNNSSSDSDSRRTSDNTLRNLITSSAVAENTEPSNDPSGDSIASGPSLGPCIQTYVNPWVLPNELSQKCRLPATLSSIESVV